MDADEEVHMSNTSKLVRRQETETATTPAVSPVDMGMLRPWQIGLLVKPMQVKLIVDLINMLTIGRTDTGSDAVPDIDLTPFFAQELGVSRHHLFLRLENDSVTVVDNKSSNGTTLNGQRLKPGQSYPLRHGDELVLGALNLQVELLINPLD